MADELSVERAMEICKPKKPVPPASGGEWPKMFYHAKLAPQGQVFETAEEFLLSDKAGWQELPIQPKLESESDD